MELYALDDDIASLDVTLSSLTGPDRLSALLPLAWYLRQRDGARALVLAEEASGWLDALPADREILCQRARLDLVRAEVAILQSRYDEGRAGLTQAQASFAALADPIGLGDTALTGYLLHQTRGVIAPARLCADEAQRQYALGADPLRRKAAESWLLLLLAYGDADVAEQRLDAWEGTDSTGVDGATGPTVYAAEHPGVAAVLLSARAVIHGARNETARAMLCAARASQRAEMAGLVRHAIASANNTGWYLQELGDLDAAAEWIEREFIAARATGWPAVLAFSTTRFGELLRHLGQLERSREVLEEAIALYGVVPGGINKGVAYRVLGKTLLALDRPDQALVAYETATKMFQAENYHERLANALIGAARSLSLAARPAEALERIEAARAVAVTHRIHSAEIELAEALAEIHQRHPLPPPAGMSAPTATVHYLEQALVTGTASDGWHAPVDLLAGLSAAWEAAGDGARALQYLKQAMAAERREGHRKAANRTLALQIRHETEQARLETLHSRQLAQAEAERAAALEAALDELRAAQAELERRRAEFERLSLLDPLTGIANRRHFGERSMAEIARARREGTSLGAVMFDIDHFKRVNDQFGHAVGDLVIRRVVELARAMLRPSDFIARVGGEEFALLIPGADALGLHHLAERIREAVAAAPMGLDRSDAPTLIWVTASFGIATLDPEDEVIEPALLRADAALYRAKHEGRNRVVG